MKGTLRLLSTLCIMVLSMTLVQAQEKTYSGTVKSGEDGQVIIGANVVVDGTSRGTSTGVNGKFTISAKAGDKLSFSYLGMKTHTVTLGATSTINVTLQSDAEAMEEVVVVAFGTVRKKDLTGSVSSINAGSIAQQQLSTASKALEGTVSGVQITSTAGGQPGVDSKITIRGVGSLSASSGALIVVDGVASSMPLSSINPNDIESMTVSKDAAANSLYGSRAANGVVLVTTKRGNEGRAKISFQARFGVTGQGVPLYDAINDPGEYYETAWQMMYNKARAYKGSPSRNADGTIKWTNPGVVTAPGGTAHNLSDAEAREYASNSLFKYPTGTASGLGNYMLYKLADPNSTLIDPSTGKIRAGSTLMYDDDWQDELVENGFRQEYNVNISGASAKTDYYISLGYLSDPAYIVGSKFNRYNARFNLNTQVTDWLRAGINIAYARRYTNRPGYETTGSKNDNPFLFMQMFGPLITYYSYDKDGNRRYDPTTNKPIYDLGTNQTYSPYGPTSRGSFNGYSPGIYLHEDIKDETTDELTSRGYLEATFLKDFKFTANLSMDNSYPFKREYGNPTSGSSARDYNGYIQNEYSKGMTLNSVQMLNWNKEINKHRMDVMIGHEFNNYVTTQMSAARSNMFLSNTPELNNAVTMQNSGGYKYKKALEGYMARVNYVYNDKYIVTGSVRHDGTSLFQYDKWGTFWSVGASWRLAQESFIADHASWVNDLKLRASYGTSGNAGLDGYPYTDLWSISFADPGIGLTQATYGNPRLTWENNKTFDVGVDFRFWDRFYGSIDYYNRTTNGMIWGRPQPASTGVSSRQDNASSMRNAGIEIELGVNIIKTEDWSWNLNINGSHNENKLLSIPQGVGSDLLGGNYQAGNFLRGSGKDYFNLYTLKYAGVDKETGWGLFYKEIKEADLAKPEWRDHKVGDIVTTMISGEATYFERGSAMPDVTGGLSTSLRYKNLDLSIITAFQIGGWAYDATYQNLMASASLGRGMASESFRYGWTPENPNGKYPMKVDGSSQNSAPADFAFTDASYFSLKSVSLGYNLSQKLAKKIHVGGVRVYVAGDNLWLLSARKGFDPRMASYQADGGGGNANVQIYTFPMTRSVSLGIDLTF